MNNAEQLDKILREQWGKKTLEELRIEAERETTGLAFEAVTIAGRRTLMIVCVTDMDQIALLEKSFDLADGGGGQEDWNTLTLSALAFRALRGSGLAFEDQRDEFNRRIAVSLISAVPHSTRMLETFFGLTP